MLKKSERSWRLLFAVCSDKSCSEMIRMLADIPFKEIYVTAISGYRAARTELIEEEFRRYTDAPLRSFPSVPEAVNRMLQEKNIIRHGNMRFKQRPLVQKGHGAPHTDTPARDCMDPDLVHVFSVSLFQRRIPVLSGGGGPPARILL